MKSPTIDSTPGSSAGRPETVVPKTTSSCAAVAAEQESPGSLEQGVEGQPVPARQRAQGLGAGLGEPVPLAAVRCLAPGLVVPPGAAEPQVGRCREAGQGPPPEGLRLGEVLRLEPADVLPVGS